MYKTILETKYTYVNKHYNLVYGWLNEENNIFNLLLYTAVLLCSGLYGQ